MSTYGNDGYPPPSGGLCCRGHPGLVDKPGRWVFLPGMPRQKYTPTRFIRQSRVALEARAAWWWWKYRGPGSLFVRHGHGERIRQKVQAAEELGTACRARKFPNRCRIPSRRARACHGAKYGCEGAMRELEPKWLRMVSSDLRIAPLRQSCLIGEVFRMGLATPSGEAGTCPQRSSGSYFKYTGAKLTGGSTL